jgi:hypothetical protein
MRYLALLILCLSCGDTKFRKVEKLETFRILGIQANTPEVNPGDSVNLQVLVSDINGSGNLSGTYITCIDPGISQGARVSCDHDSSAMENSVSINMAALQPTATGRTGFSSEIFSLSIPATNVIYAGRSERDRSNGVSYLAIFTINGVTSFKRILVSPRTTADPSNSPNTNPTGTSLSLNGSAAGLPSDGHFLSVTTSSAQVYRQTRVDGVVETRTERYEVAWYTSNGEFDKPKAGIDEDTKFKGDGEPSLVMAVIRDERGGVDFAKFPP